MKQNEILNLIDVDVIPYQENEVDVESTVIPFEEILTLGFAAELTQPIFEIINKKNEMVDQLYKIGLPEGAHLSDYKDGKFGTLSDNEQIQNPGQSMMDQMDKVSLNPSTIAMMGMLANMEKQLDDIRELQEEMMKFIELKEKSEQRGNLAFLQDIYENYKFNTDNEKYLENNHLKVLDIKQTAEQKIEFYKTQIKDVIDKDKLLHSDFEVNKDKKSTKNNLGEYQLALYTYAFASLMDIIFLENYNEEFLRNIKNKILSYKEEYQSLYDSVMGKIEVDAQTSVEQHILGGVSKASKLLGGKLKNTSFGKKHNVEDKMNWVSEGVGNYKEHRADISGLKLIENNQAKVDPFIENIDKINQVYNKPVEVLFDKKGIYIKQTEVD